MADTAASAIVELVSPRRGHFRLESGHHGALWLDLDALFADPVRIDPFVSRLAELLERYDLSVVCGPLLGGAFLAQLLSRKLGLEFSFTERLIPEKGDDLYPARYRLPLAYVERIRGRRVAMVDDVMSAGSALRGTCSEIESNGAVPVVAAALLVLGTTGRSFFATRGIPVETVASENYELWVPEECPLCAAGTPIEEV